MKREEKMQRLCCPNSWILYYYTLVFFDPHRQLDWVQSLRIHICNAIWAWNEKAFLPETGKTFSPLMNVRRMRLPLDDDDDETETQIRRPVFFGTRKIRHTCTRSCMYRLDSATALYRASRETYGSVGWSVGSSIRFAWFFRGDLENCNATVVFLHGWPARNAAEKIYYTFIGT